MDYEENTKWRSISTGFKIYSFFCFRLFSNQKSTRNSRMRNKIGLNQTLYNRDVIVLRLCWKSIHTETQTLNGNHVAQYTKQNKCNTFLIVMIVRLQNPQINTDEKRTQNNNNDTKHANCHILNWLNESIEGEWLRRGFLKKNLQNKWADFKLFSLMYVWWICNEKFSLKTGVILIDCCWRCVTLKWNKNKRLLNVYQSS